METQQALLERMRGFESDHTPDGWPAIRMREVSALCDALLAQQVVIEQMREALCWYRYESIALATNAEENKDMALLASVRVLALDAGKRADTSIALQPDLSALREHDACVVMKFASNYRDGSETFGENIKLDAEDFAEQIRKGE